MWRWEKYRTELNSKWTSVQQKLLNVLFKHSIFKILILFAVHIYKFSCYDLPFYVFKKVLGKIKLRTIKYFFFFFFSLLSNSLKFVAGD